MLGARLQCNPHYYSGIPRTSIKVMVQVAMLESVGVTIFFFRLQHRETIYLDSLVPDVIRTFSLALLEIHA